MKETWVSGGKEADTHTKLLGDGAARGGISVEGKEREGYRGREKENERRGEITLPFYETEKGKQKREPPPPLTAKQISSSSFTEQTTRGRHTGEFTRDPCEELTLLFSVSD